MALMRSPDGAETVDVPPDEISHYINLGATLVPVESPGGSSIPYTGTPDEALADPGLLDPLNYIPAPPVAGLAGVGARAAAGGLAGATEGALKGAAPTIGRAAGGMLAEMGLEMLPAPARIAARGVMAALRNRAAGAAETVAEGAGKKAAVATERAVARRVAGKAAQKVEAQVGQTASRAGKKTIQEGEKKIAGRIRPVRGGKPKIGTTASRVRPRGATNPVLARRAAQINPGGAPYTGPDVGAQLQQMQEAMQYAQSQGLNPQEAYALIRQLLAGAKP